MDKMMTKQIALYLTGALIFGFLGGILGTKVNLDNNLESNSVVSKTVVNEDSEMIQAIAKVKPTVVSIVATKDLKIINRNPFGSPFDQFFFGPSFGNGNNEVETQRRQVSGGTGFIVSKDGTIITNKHVVRDEDADYSVVLNDGKRYRAEVVSRDPINDLAVIQLYEGEEGNNKPNDLPIVDFGDSDSLQIGQKVIAIGNALGEFQNTVTSGILSGSGRQIIAGDSNGANSDTLSNLLQTDAAINSGNSGGPLINLSGQVIGVNTAIASNGNGIGFAIPVNDLKPVYESVKEFGRIIRPQIGVRYAMLNDTSAKDFGLEINKGALLVGDADAGQFAVLPNSPADKAGLRERDVIVAIEGKEITENYGLREAIRAKKPGDKVALRVWRNGKEFDLELNLDEFDSNNN